MISHPRQVFKNSQVQLSKYFQGLFSFGNCKEINNYSFFSIRGFAKSGTSWLSNLMNLHPQILVTGEWGFNGLAEAREYILNTAVWTVCHHPKMKGQLDKSFENMIKQLMLEKALTSTSVAKKIWLGDKTPNPAYPPIIKRSKCLYIIRDIRDVTVSRAYHLLRVNGTWGLASFPKMMNKLEEYGGNLQYFKDNPDQLLDDLDWVRDNVKAWAKNVDQVLNAQSMGLQEYYPEYEVKIIYYEDLHADIEAARSSCYSFLGLDPKKALPLDSTSIKTSPGFSSERPQEFYRKGIVGDWKNYFSNTLEEIVYEEAGEILKLAGYIE